VSFDQNLINKVIDLFKNEVIPAEGCTEPIAIAYATAKAREILGCEPEHINLLLSGNIIKNVKSVFVPNSGNMVGIEVAAAMGALAGDASQELMVLSKVTPEQMVKVREFLAKDTVHYAKSDNNLKLYIKVKMIAGNQSVSVELKHVHNNITEIVKNGEIEFRVNEKSSKAKIENDAEILNIKLIYDLAKEIDINLLRPILEKIISCNTAISIEGLTHDYGVRTGKNIKTSIERGFYGKDARNLSASNAAAASDARMGGSAMPVMTAAGSGNVGLTSSIPIITYCRENGLSEDKMMRGLIFSILASVHIKSNIGRLSAYCGPMCAAGAVSGALVFLNDESYDVVAKAIINTLSGVSGVFCDGANSSCSVKIANGTYAAFDGAASAMNGNVVTPGDGIVADDVESTIRNIGELARDGMRETDDVILEIMTRK
jgi:L-cysteine desulfidase